MARLTKFVAIAVCSMGFAVGAPATSQAGVIPWVYDAVFGPVGSLRYGSTYYGPTYSAAAYRGYGYSSYYAPTTTVAYAPYGYGGGGGCSSCGQSSYYTPYASYGGYAQSYYVPNSGCASGNCSSCGGGNCSNCSGNCLNCTTNSVSTSAGYAGGPVPDSQFNSDHQKIERLYDRFDRLEHEIRQQRDFLKKEHRFEPEDYRPSTTGTYREHRDNSTTVRPRTGTERRDQFNSDDKDFVIPERAPHRAPARDLGEERNKPTILDDEKKTDDDKKIDADKKTDADKKKDQSKIEIPLPTGDAGADSESGGINLSSPVNIGPAPEQTPEARRLLERQTAKAVAPRQRAGQEPKPAAKAIVSKPRRTSSKVKLDSSLDAGIARH